MTAIREFLAMGGYGGFVWPSYLLAAAVLLGLFLVSRGELRRRQRRLAELEAGRPRRHAQDDGKEQGAARP